MDLWVHSFERDGKSFRIAKTPTICMLLADEVYDWQPEHIMVGFFIVGVPEAAGTTVQVTPDEIEWTIQVFAANICGGIVEALDSGGHLTRGTIH